MTVINRKEIDQIIDRYVSINFSVNRKFDQLIRQEIGDVLTTEQHFTMRHINNVHVCTSTELAVVFGVKKSAITPIINRLVEKGWVERTRDEKDRRVIYLTLTIDGKVIFGEMEKKIQSVIESVISKFDHTEIQNFLDTYAKLDGLIEGNKE
ncbi:MarR family winged helix-turn-helix transcriptional regulator [Niallia sp. Sow4_A1]|uniref:MarR family winged helix-turn-helix transcriptional regulator n=1 Tax=Bacillaceae TaxID=186817 RepID=UPI0009DF105C|nr:MULTISPECIES: MarR family transcriptional regulator [Bacillaceae]MCF2647028.1 MarR family transcriptional regulator [Niallia circulans]MCM3361985.1 MarR family transcriptional regulator [Niallia sp. MER TA 168]